jgi:predicted TIM-barrel fold metal-dependent hydrolase
VRTEDLIILSIDDHLIEPPDMFDQHVPAKYADQAPKLLRDADGLEKWVFQNTTMGVMGLNSVVSWPKEQWGRDPATLSEMRPGSYDIHERIRDMNRNGVLASMCFPTFPGFSGRTFHEAAETGDPELSTIMLRAYNDWHIDEWCAAYPGRFMPLALPPIWDIEALVAEVHRVAAKGCHAMSMPELPHLLGLPSYQSPHWDPFWQAVCDDAVVVCLHIGQGFQALTMAEDMSNDHFMVLATQVSMLSVQDLMWGPALRKYPDLKIAWSEGGIGWIPFLLDRCDRHYQNQKWTGQDFGDKLPSDVFREHALACFISDPMSLKLAHEIGIDILAFESDYPHSDGLWPDAPEHFLAECDGANLSDEDINKISWQNVARFLDYDPFSVIAKKNATVGALRALAPDVETGEVPREIWRARYEEHPHYKIETISA